MSRVLTMGWENRCRHPQLITFYQFECEGALSYPAGGVEGIGYMTTAPTDIVNAWTHAMAAKYNLLSAGSEIFLDLDFRLVNPIAAIDNNQATIWWDDKDNSDPGYIQLDSHTDTVYWSWSGSSGSFPWIISNNQWTTVDLRIKVVPAGNDEIELKIDGFDVFSVSENVTCAFTEIDQIWLGMRDNFVAPRTTMQSARFDNVKVNTTTGIAPDNTWPWHVVLIGLPLTGAGTYTQLDPIPGPPNWQNVDDPTPDDDDYNRITEKDQKDTYHFTDTPATVLGSNNWEATRFILRNRHRVAVPAGEGWTPTLRVNGSDYDGTPEASGSAFACFEMIWPDNPDTGLPWEHAEIDAAEAGAKSHD